jgi:proline dehydrogenase
MEPQPQISFNNTEIAFAHKSDQELKKARFLFKSMGIGWLVKLGTRLTPLAIRWHLPIKGIIRNTIFKQFVGGETLDETAKVADKLEEYGVQVILDYGVEGGDYGETSLNQACDEFIKVIDYAATQANIPFMSIKVTGIARFTLLEQLDTRMHASGKESLVKRYEAALAELNDADRSEWKNVCDRMRCICDSARKNNIGVLVDAEETWIQDPVDALVMLMMDEYNKEHALLYNTIQLYRHDRLAFLKESHAAAEQRNFILGAKLVRGAYMEKERRRSSENNYPSPIQPDKESSDKDYNYASAFCVENISRIAFIVASHNEFSNMVVTQLMKQKCLPLNHAHLHFSQLYGMSDNITFNLARAGCSVSKYLPFGPIKDVIPYLMRRAQENSSVAGQTGRELGLINKEMERRKKG